MRKFLSFLICAMIMTSSSFSNTALAADLYESEYNNDFSYANKIAIGDTLNGSISSATDSDMFILQVSPSSYANITLSKIPSGCDYDLYLYDSNKNLKQKSSNSGASDENIYAALTKGTYYIKVVSYSGSSDSYYKLSITTDSPTPPSHGGDRYEFNDTFALASDIGSGNSFTISDANIHPLGDLDYFKFKLTNNVNAVITIASPSSDYYFTIYDSNHNYLRSGGGTSELIANLTSGTYYIKVYSYKSESVLNYSLKMTSTPLSTFTSK